MPTSADHARPGCHWWLAHQCRSRSPPVPLLACPAVRRPVRSAFMPQAAAHRNRVRHFHDPGHCRELTCSCYHRLPLLTNDLWRAMLSQSIDRAVENHRYRLVAFVYMPEHVHLLLYPLPDSPGVDRLLHAIKRPYAYRIKMLLSAGRSPLLAKPRSASGRALRRSAFGRRGRVTTAT